MSRPLRPVAQRLLFPVLLAGLVLGLSSCGLLTPPSRTLSLSGGNGSVSVDGTPQTLPYVTTFPSGTQVTLTALPDSGYAFAGWSGGGSGTANPLTFTLDADTSIGVAFQPTGAPIVTLSSPADGSSAGARNVQVTGSASAAGGVQAVTWSQNDGAAQACLGTSSFTCTVGPLDVGANTISVVATDAAGNSSSASLTLNYATTETGDPFDITLAFATSVTDTQLTVFQDAAARWSQIITQGLPDTTVTVPAGSCSGLPLSTFSGLVDDLRIAVQVAPIDGVGGILGQGGPCLTRSADHLPVYGIMELDVADLDQLQQQGLLETTILHEMGHVLGFGTIWGSLLTGANTTDPRFQGTNAVREWQALGGTGDVPVENCRDASGQPIQGCGTGTKDSHWREAVFGNELMTGYINLGSDPLSRVTVGSLEDLGYSVDLAAADPYSLPVGTSALATTAPAFPEFRLLTPRGSVP